MLVFSVWRFEVGDREVLIWGKGYWVWVGGGDREVLVIMGIGFG